MGLGFKGSNKCGFEGLRGLGLIVSGLRVGNLGFQA